MLFKLNEELEQVISYLNKLFSLSFGHGFLKVYCGTAVVVGFLTFALKRVGGYTPQIGCVS